MLPPIKAAIMALIAAVTIALGIAFWQASESNASEQAVLTPVSFITVTAGPTSAVPIESPVVEGISENAAVGIAMEVAGTKGDADPELVSVSVATLSEAINELSPGMDLVGYALDESVFVVRLKGGPFQHARSIPTNRDPAEFITNGVFVVIRASDGDVIGTGGLRY